jgi:hypothetical protein
MRDSILFPTTELAQPDFQSFRPGLGADFGQSATFLPTLPMLESITTHTDSNLEDTGEVAINLETCLPRTRQRSVFHCNFSNNHNIDQKPKSIKK